MLSALTLVLLAQAPPDVLQLTRSAIEQMQAAMEERQVVDAFERMRAFTGLLLDNSSGEKRWSDKTGNCRLPLVDAMLRDPFEAIAQGEALTREVHAAAGNVNALSELSQITRRLTNVAPTTPPTTSPTAPVTEPASVAPPELMELEAILSRVLDHQRQMLVTFSQAEAQALAERLVEVTTPTGRSGAFWSDIALGRELADSLERIDRNALFLAAEEMMLLAQPALRDRLGGFASIHASTRRVETAAGVVLLGTGGDDTFDLNDPTVVAVIDPGGNDTYIEGAVNLARPMLFILDVGGDDIYRGTQPAIQGSAILGVSLLIDRAGNDRYEAADIAQGAAIGGVGILIDESGDDTFVGQQRVQASAICGMGLLIDRAGNDSYKAARSAQGFGGPLGFGLLDDLEGNDHYYAGGLYLDSYPDTPGYDAWSQGVGSGPRGSANGGIGMLLDGAGDDAYEYDYFSHGAGYWFAAGFARDFGGDDVRHGATRTDFEGALRPLDATRDGVEQRFLRWGTGIGCHYGIGIVYDDDGNDSYGGDVVGTGFAWDIGVGAVLDFAGDDVYAATSGAQQGVAAEVGLGLLFDASGDDRYLAPSAGTASPMVSYHAMPDAGGNFSFVIDLAGNDAYAERLPNGQTHERASPQGWIIDR